MSTKNTKSRRIHKLVKSGMDYKSACKLLKNTNNVPQLYQIKKTYMMSETERVQYTNNNPLNKLVKPSQDFDTDNI